MDRIYLDGNSSMPVRKEVLEEMLPYFTEHFGNPSSIHELGREPRKGIERAREQVAELICAEPEEIVFTSGATESINLALRGPIPFRRGGRNHLITTVLDHDSVRVTSSAIGSSGIKVDSLPVDRVGRIIAGRAKEMIGDDVYMVTIPFASQEVGTVQPTEEIVEIAKESGSLVHLDMTTSAFQMEFDVSDVPVDLVTLSSVDLLGPKGVGALYVRKGTGISSLIKGGGHERGLRSGSENVPGIVGMGAAAMISKERMGDVSRSMASVRDRIIDGLLKVPDSHLNGHRTERLPNNANIRFDYIEGESMLLLLDMNGVCVSSGSACTQKNLEPSRTLLAMGLKHEEAHGSLQFTLTPFNTMKDADRVAELMPGIVERLREMSPLYNDREK